MKTLNVKPTTVYEISKKWGGCSFTGEEPLFIRCNSKGEINWEKNPVYKGHELKNKKVVVIF